MRGVQITLCEHEDGGSVEDSKNGRKVRLDEIRVKIKRSPIPHFSPSSSLPIMVRMGKREKNTKSNSKQVKKQNVDSPKIQRYHTPNNCGQSLHDEGKGGIVLKSRKRFREYKKSVNYLHLKKVIVVKLLMQILRYSSS
jgi:hypothetical protein